MNPDQNLLKAQTPAYKSQLTGPGVMFLVVLDALALFAALSFGYLYQLYLTGGTSVSWLVCSLAVFTVLAVFQSLLEHNPRRRVGLMLLEVVALLTASYAMPPYLLLVTGVLMLAFMVWGEWNMQYQLRNNLRVRFFSSVRPLINKIVTAMVLMMVLLYLPKLGDQQDYIAEQTFDSFFSLAAVAMSKVYPTVPFDSTVGKFIEGIVQYQLEGNPAFKNLSPSAQTKAVQVATAQMLNDWGQKLGTEVKSAETLSRAFYHIVLATLNHWKDTFGGNFYLGWAILVFLVVRSLGFFFSWAVAIAALVLYELLLAGNVITVIGEEALHEVITLAASK